MSINLHNFRLDNGTVSGQSKAEKHSRVKGGFIRGPLPLVWFQRVAHLSGRGPLVVALALWYRAGLEKKTADLKLGRKLWSEFGLRRQTAADALKALETAGLIRVTRRPGRSPLVSILDVATQDGEDPTQAGDS